MGKRCHSIERLGPGVEGKSARQFPRDDLCPEPAKAVEKCFENCLLFFNLECLYICSSFLGSEVHMTAGIPLLFSVISALRRRRGILGNYPLDTIATKISCLS